MIIPKVIATIQRHGMLEHGDHVVVGVSGGADSMCLLHVLLALRDKWNLRLTVAHLDHMLRGEQSRMEADFVQEWSKRLGLTCIVEHRDVGKYRGRSCTSLQEAARTARYEFLTSVLDRVGAQRIALGHNADDQAETVLMRLLRGAALTGLAGMMPVRDGRIIRPLIYVQRIQIEEYLRHHSIVYFPDTSVHEQHYLRNKIRHHLLPLLKEQYNPQIIATLTRTARALRGDEAALEALAARAAAESFVRKDAGILFSLEKLRSEALPLRPRIVRQMIKISTGDLRRITFWHIDRICRLVEESGPSKTVHLPGGIVCAREYDMLVFRRVPATSTGYYYCFDALPDRVEISEIGKTILFEITTPPDDLGELMAPSGDRVCIDYDAVRMPLVIRNWQPGDRFKPLGLSGTKKLQDFFSDRKIPRSQRPLVPIVLFQDKIAWVCGYQIDDSFKVRRETIKIVSMRVI